jgi:GTP cyclohydrolase I
MGAMAGDPRPDIGRVNHGMRSGADRIPQQSAPLRSPISPISRSGDEELGSPDVGRGVGSFDEQRIRGAVRELLIAIGEDPDRDGLRDTPGRVARAYREMFAGLTRTPEEVLTTTFDLGHDELVLVRDIELYSCCEHHLVPFHGVAHVGYIPSVDGRITGLSKLARLVDVYAKRPQVQERLTTQVADALVRILEPRGVIVVVECEHLCMSMRGIRKPGAKTVTSAVRGVLRSPATRAEAMSLILGR